MVGWALCFELNFCIIILYDTAPFIFHKKKGGEDGVSQTYTVWY